MSLEETWGIFQQLCDPKSYYNGDELVGVMGSMLTCTTRTVYSMAKDNRFTRGMLRDLIHYRNNEPDITLCLVTDQPSAFDEIRNILEQRYNFICIPYDDVMYSFYFKEKRS